MEASSTSNFVGAPKDYIGFQTIPKLMNLLDPHEKLVFVDKVKKFSPCGWFKQERFLAVTTENIYNIKSDVVKRRIPIASLAGITKNLIGAKNELIFHVGQDYDYRYMAESRRQEIIDSVKAAFADKCQVNLPIFGVDSSGLKAFVTT